MASSIIGVSRSIQRIRELIQRVAGTCLNIVITGESGVGKELVAQTLHSSSQRKNKPFVKVNCAALPEGLLESELFGHERGAFTGAERKMRGKFELAHTGVIFLDEISEMSVSLQAKLLHVLQNGEFSPLGSEGKVKTDAWVIAATNSDLEQITKAGSFREDLYYRMNIINIFIPPLRQRPEDIPLLIEHYFDKYASTIRNTWPAKPSGRVMEKLMVYSWPGNVRELQNILQRVQVVGDWDEILAELFSGKSIGGDSDTGQFEMRSPRSILDYVDHIGQFNTGRIQSLPLKKIRKEVLNRLEKEVIALVLEETGWNRTRASKILDISYRTMLAKITEHEITPPKILR
ncbi:MAG: sigma-54-dependent Fis family transcriptional regulator [Deltaproteobacteria bacterium]|nr:sigma-54-dependent Fis family transcriptional regulator [Deltaproteobacteria bacterium]